MATLSTRLVRRIAGLATLGLAFGAVAQTAVPSGGAAATTIQIQAIENQLHQERTAAKRKTDGNTTSEAIAPCRNGDMVRHPDGRLEFIKEDCGQAGGGRDGRDRRGRPY